MTTYIVHHRQKHGEVAHDCTCSPRREVNGSLDGSTGLHVCPLFCWSRGRQLSGPYDSWGGRSCRPARHPVPRARAIGRRDATSFTAKEPGQARLLPGLARNRLGRDFQLSLAGPERSPRLPSRPLSGSLQVSVQKRLRAAQRWCPGGSEPRGQMTRPGSKGGQQFPPGRHCGKEADDPEIPRRPRRAIPERRAGPAAREWRLLPLPWTPGKVTPPRRRGPPRAQLFPLSLLSLVSLSPSPPGALPSCGEAEVGARPRRAQPTCRPWRRRRPASPGAFLPLSSPRPSLRPDPS
ncbi:uncharacterized protein [Macaca fascicularis]|uniref:uncharacterized protein n=1 Tax=Macaca fascicularis TaxID=9541 RepID=UPI003D156558